jgi:hypothetical protein
MREQPQGQPPASIPKLFDGNQRPLHVASIERVPGLGCEQLRFESANLRDDNVRRR